MKSCKKDVKKLFFTSFFEKSIKNIQNIWKFYKNILNFVSLKVILRLQIKKFIFVFYFLIK
ncbi:hypothetical protein CSB08_00205 [Candidatus Gracilibacteria bacterium]|nr:MAG: hypothetical protein CSB08_00205 [Candidatus Gracilibacteria bacterium]PIE85266.1 MAG: hypothetical protein CSA08_02555 [Candidatus Gracilibacteria bacterium]